MKLPLSSLALLAVACGGSPKPADTAKAEPPPPAKEATTTAAKPADTGAKKDEKQTKDAKKGPIKFAAFPGPSTAPAKGNPIWAIAPVQNSDWTSSVGFYRADVLRLEGNTAIVKGVHDEEVWVPGALTKDQTSATYKVGQAVLVARDVSLITGGSYGRVAKVAKDGDTTTITVKYEFAGEVSDAEIDDPKALLALDDKLAFGAPVAFKDGDHWTTAKYVGPGSEKGKAWVLEWAGKLTQHDNVKPLTVTKVFKKGEKVWAAPYATLGPATITDVIDGGVEYKVKPASGDEKTIGYDFVTSPL